MKKVLITSSLVIIAACVSHVETEKVNVITDDKTVIAPNCPNWTKDSAGDYRNEVGSNFRCANITNFGAMIENPDDMITGRQSSKSGSTRGAMAVMQYESGQVAASAAATGATGN